MRKRISGIKYKRSQEKYKLRVKQLEELIKINYRLKNTELYKKLGISETEFYRTYAESAREVKKYYKSIALF